MPSHVHVRKIQRFWRTHSPQKTLKSLCEKVIELGPTTAQVRSISFEDLVVYLREGPTIQRSKTCLERIHRLSVLLHRATGVPGQEEKVNVRIFLAAYMIAVYPANVFENRGGELEVRLMASAKLLVDTFEKILRFNGSFHGIPRDITRSFPSHLFNYIRDFKAWKVPDEAKLLARIRHALIALYQARAFLPVDEPEDSGLNTEFRTQIARLKEKLLKIGGADVFNQFERDHPEGAFGPGPAGAPPTGANAQANQAVVQESLRVQGAVVALLSDRMNNEQLAHELLFDRAFQLSDRGTSFESEATQRIRDSFHRAFWDSLISDLELSPPCFVRLLRVLIEIRDGLVAVAPPPFGALAAEILDMEIIKQRAENGVYDWVGCNELISTLFGVIRRVQSERRRLEVAEKCTLFLWAGEGPRAVCMGLEGLLDCINLLRVDAANRRLTLIAPIIHNHGVDYERGKFQEKINSGALTLVRTEVWIKESRQPTHYATLVDAVAKLVVDMEQLRDDVCPETLLMDVRRINGLRESLARVAQSVTLVMLLGNPNGECKIGAELAGIAAALKQDAKDMRAAVETVLGAEMMTPAVFIAIEQSSDPTNALYVLTRTRVVNAIKTGDLARFHDLVKPQVTQFLVDVNRLIQLNYQVHELTYARILDEPMN